MTEFSVLLPVYIGDSPAYFERALRSIGADQTLPPNEILIVCDGPVQPEIDAVLDAASTGGRSDLTGTAALRIVRLPENRGLSEALNTGLDEVAYDIVARADADDIATPARFATQIPLMEDHDIVGSAIAEFESDETRTGMVRRMPETHEEIAAIVHYRDPFNHPSVVYRRSAVMKVGGYEHLNYMEDYWLFARMVAANLRCLNVPEALVLYRTGAGAYERRGGWHMLRSELELQRRMYAAGMTTIPQRIRNTLIRGGYRLIPADVRQRLYRGVGQRRWFGQGLPASTDRE